MRFIYGERELTLEFHENEVQVITIENREYFSAFLQNLYNQSQGSDGNIILSEGEKILSLNKVAEIVWNPFSVDINNKKILGKLFQELKTVSMEEQYAEICELNTKVVHYLDDLNLKIPYPIQFRLELDVLDLYKIYGVQLDTEEIDMFERLLEYVKVLKSLCGVGLLVFVNVKNYLSETQIKELYKIAFYYKMNLLLVEAHQGKNLECEKNQLIDEDMCFIHY